MSNKYADNLFQAIEKIANTNSTWRVVTGEIVNCTAYIDGQYVYKVRYEGNIRTVNTPLSLAEGDLVRLGVDNTNTISGEQCFILEKIISNTLTETQKISKSYTRKGTVLSIDEEFDYSPQELVLYDIEVPDDSIISKEEINNLNVSLNEEDFDHIVLSLNYTSAIASTKNRALVVTIKDDSKPAKEILITLSFL